MPASDQEREQEKERKRLEALEAKRYPMEDLDLLREQREKFARGELSVVPAADVALPAGRFAAWVAEMHDDAPPAGGAGPVDSELVPRLMAVSAFTSHWKTDLGIKQPYLLDELMEILEVGAARARHDPAAHDSRLQRLAELYEILLENILEKPNKDGSACRTQRRWYEIMDSDGTWPELVKR